MEGSKSNLFEKLPDEVLQLIFAAIGDCKTLVHCMVVSKAFQGHASKVNSLIILFPKQFTTYDQKLWNIYSMVKTFKALESLIVCVGQPKIEPPPSWARCMRYAEIGVAVEKFVFMAAKIGDFVEFDSSLGLRHQFINGKSRNIEIEDLFNNEYKILSSKNNNEHDVDPGLLINDEIALFGEDNERDLNNDANADNSRQEQGSGLFSIRTIDSIRYNDENLMPQLSVQDASNINTIVYNKNNLEYEKGESSESFNMQDHTKGQISLFKKTDKPLNQQQFNQENLHQPIINFHLKQVIAPSNDVLKRMVPVIVFAIVQGLDEFRDSVPNFIEKFVNLKRFVLVDVVESLTVHMREHQIQQVRTQRLETINRYIGERVATKNIVAKTNSKSENCEIEKREVANKNKNKTSHCNHSNKVKQVGEKIHLDDKNTKDCNKGEDSRNAPLKLQIHEIKPKFLNSKFDNKSSMFESCSQEERLSEENLKICETQTSQKCNQIIKSPIPSIICDVCQDSKSQANYAKICWHHFSNGFSSSIPPINFIKSNTLSCNLPPLPHVERLIGNWSCNDPSLKAWLKGKQSLAGPEDISQVSKAKVVEIECMPKEHKKIKDCTHIRTFEEIMACRLRDDLYKQLPDIPTISNSKTINEGTSNQTMLNSRVTFSNNHNLMSVRKNIDQITPRPTTSIMKKTESSKKHKVSEFFLESSQHINKWIEEEEESRSDLWEKPPSTNKSSRSSSTSCDSSKSENPNLKFEVHELTIPQRKLYGKNKISLKRNKYLDDPNNKFKICQLKYKSNYRNYKTLKESNTNYIGKHSFKRGLQKETSRRREGDRAFRIANSRRYDNNCLSKNGVWMEGLSTKENNEENIPLLECSVENPKDFWNFTNNSNCFSNETKLGVNKEVQNKLEVAKGKKSLVESFNYEKRTLCNEIPLEIHEQITIHKQDGENCKSANNDIPSITSLHESEQLLPIASNHNRHLNAIGFEGVVLVPYESNSTIVNNRLQGFCDLEDINSQSQISFHDANITNIEDYPRGDLSPSLSPQDDDMLQNEVAWIGARARERSGMRRLGRRSRTRSTRRENHAHVEREREARQERLHEGIQKRQRDIEQEALFFDISFWRSEQVATPNYVLSEVSMCIATHDAKPLTEEELQMLSTVALAGPLLVATMRYVNGEIGSHNL